MSSTTFSISRPRPRRLLGHRIPLATAATVVVAGAGLSLALTHDGLSTHATRTSVGAHAGSPAVAAESAAPGPAIQFRPARVLRTASIASHSTGKGVRNVISSLFASSPRQDADAQAESAPPAQPNTACRTGSTYSGAAAHWAACIDTIPRQVTVTLPQVGVGRLPSVTGPAVSLGHLPGAQTSGRTVTVDVGLDPQVTGPTVDLGNPVTVSPAGVDTH